MGQVKRISCSFPMLVLLFLSTSCSFFPSNQNASGSQTRELPGEVAINNIFAPNPLRSYAQEQGFFIGSAVNIQAFQNDAQYTATLGYEFNSVTPETSLEFATVHPAPNVYNFQEADSIVAFAKAHGMRVRGHPLLWPNSPNIALPDWLRKGHFTRDQLLAIMHDYITKVVSHFRGEIPIWDVLNEAIDPSGHLRDCIWLRVIGPDYITWAFRWAHEADPKAQLVYNDYANDSLGVKSDAVYNLLKNLIQQGVPVSGVGFELHLRIGGEPPLDQMRANINRLAALGLKIHVTEMDVITSNVNEPEAEKLSAEAKIYYDMLSVCLETKACKEFTMWGFTDRYTWILWLLKRQDMPLIFDSSYHPKPAYNALVNAFTRAGK